MFERITTRHRGYDTTAAHAKMVEIHLWSVVTPIPCAAFIKAKQIPAGDIIRLDGSIRTSLK